MRKFTGYCLIALGVIGLIMPLIPGWLLLLPGIFLVS